MAYQGQKGEEICTLPSPIRAIKLGWVAVRNINIGNFMKEEECRV
jgi:hypothetical protein